MLSAEERTAALDLARRAIARAVAPGSAPADRSSPLPAAFGERRGVFVTLKRFPSLALRGCIGFPLPVLPLREGLAQAAAAAALEDPRFPPVRADELPRIAIEVSVLSVPLAIPHRRPDEIVGAIEVGRDGLLVEGRGTSGLLLPQVASEQGWSAAEFLAGTCEKAGLPPEAWRDLRVTVRRFEAEVFHERSPGGPPEGDPPPVSGPAGPRARRS